MGQKAAHTAGPWSLTTVPTSVGSCHKVGPFPARVPDGAPTFACIYADGIRIGIDDGLPTAIELAANARLIAAAPELLAALETAYMALIGYLPAHRNDVTDAAIGAARAAITKATGEAA